MTFPYVASSFDEEEGTWVMREDVNERWSFRR
jgi:hypothetical protein